jgi:hypothetical protein
MFYMIILECLTNRKESPSETQLQAKMWFSKNWDCFLLWKLKLSHKREMKKIEFESFRSSSFKSTFFPIFTFLYSGSWISMNHQ